MFVGELAIARDMEQLSGNIPFGKAGPPRRTISCSKRDTKVDQRLCNFGCGRMRGTPGSSPSPFDSIIQRRDGPSKGPNERNPRGAVSGQVQHTGDGEKTERKIKKTTKSKVKL